MSNSKFKTGSKVTFISGPPGPYEILSQRFGQIPVGQSYAPGGPQWIYMVRNLGPSTIPGGTFEARESELRSA